METRLRDMPEVGTVTVAGSVRRRKETIGDIDILVVSRKPEMVMDRFSIDAGSCPRCGPW